MSTEPKTSKGKKVVAVPTAEPVPNPAKKRKGGSEIDDIFGVPAKKAQPPIAEASKHSQKEEGVTKEKAEPAEAAKVRLAASSFPHKKPYLFCFVSTAGTKITRVGPMHNAQHTLARHKHAQTDMRTHHANILHHAET